ncbi:hypothetical protein KS4_13940 [Poriferisphaera corsica]|uniref:Uncharacterized protein n=1 Tax=Poriferisphaera corsica TaxID=2528020 RepID=A0A517YSZ6_9BACT|nr:hypothetical protein [Poriferisphaera corsica]QDU33348.1 hypothetical protein KS4_13940 [Poriferisphaera corsica]
MDSRGLMADEKWKVEGEEFGLDDKVSKEKVTKTTKAVDALRFHVVL